MEFKPISQCNTRLFSYNGMLLSLLKKIQIKVDYNTSTEFF